MAELLCPAKNLQLGKVAVSCGADAVYAGLEGASARQRAGISLTDMEQLCAMAHRYQSRVYAAVNILFSDRELVPLSRQIWRLSEMGVDGLIIQDLGLLGLDLPRIPLIASTQLHNTTPKKVEFLSRIGFSRAILARECSPATIREIHRRVPDISLESFVHGALCVGYSGQCYLSENIGHRSANRGECAQPCRRHWRLLGPDHREVTCGHLLSLRDLNRTDQLDELLACGVDSFKIEGRLKDETYVKQVVTHYRRAIDQLVGHPHGDHIVGAPENTTNLGFNRGFVSGFATGQQKMAALHNPGRQGTFAGDVTRVGNREIQLSGDLPIVAGDGLMCQRGATRVGQRVIDVQGPWLKLLGAVKFRVGDQLWRSRSESATRGNAACNPQRTVPVRLVAQIKDRLCKVTAIDPEGRQVTVSLDEPGQIPREPELASTVFCNQMKKSGQTEFEVLEVALDGDETPFWPKSVLNGVRRQLLAELRALRTRTRPALPVKPVSIFPCPEPVRDYARNAVNQYAVAFLKQCGVSDFSPPPHKPEPVLRSAYCVLREIGMCWKNNPGSKRENIEKMVLVGPDGVRFRLETNCGRCEMTLYELGESDGIIGSTESRPL